MEISLSSVRTVLRKALGFESLTARFIERVTEDPHCKTAFISKTGSLTYNPGFVSKYVKTKEDLFSLIFHEVLHKVFGHFIYHAGLIENIAADAIINAVISNIYSEQSCNGELFRKFYPPTGINGILRPASDMRNSRYTGIYEKLYRNHRYLPKRTMTTGELIQTMRILADTKTLPAILLLGSHNQNKGSELPAEIISKIASDVQASIGKKDSKAGYSEILEQLFVDILKSRISLPRKLLERYTTRRKIDRFKELLIEQQRSTSPIPLYPSKRDIVLLASGIWPANFHNRQIRPNKHDTGMAIYLDVSGSVNEYLPKIIGAISKLKTEVISLFLFSNRVVEISMKDLIKGNIETTWGTDFDCIAESIIERKFDKAVVITDGYASLSEELSNKLKEKNLSILTILFNGRNDCPDFELFGDVIQLEDIT